MMKLSKNRGQRKLTKALSGSLNELMQAGQIYKTWMWLQKSVQVSPLKIAKRCNICGEFEEKCKICAHCDECDDKKHLGGENFFSPLMRWKKFPPLKSQTLQIFTANFKRLS